MNKQIPKELSHLKIDERGYPIPFFVPKINGKYEFRFADAKKQRLCIEQKLCAICGKKLIDNLYFFITGPVGYQNRVVTDSAMHRICAEYSLEVCPYMHFEKADIRDRDPLYKSVQAINLPQLPKPKELYLIKSDKFKSEPNPMNGGSIIRFRPVSYEVYIYENGILKKKQND